MKRCKVQFWRRLRCATPREKTSSSRPLSIDAVGRATNAFDTQPTQSKGYVYLSVSWFTIRISFECSLAQKCEPGAPGLYSSSHGRRWPAIRLTYCVSFISFSTIHPHHHTKRSYEPAVQVRSFGCSASASLYMCFT